MDSVILPYPKIDMRVDDVDVKLESSNDEMNNGNEEDNFENYDANKELFSESYDEINFHFMSTGDATLESKDPHRRFHCNFCGKGFIRREHLVNHKRTHTGERPFQCEYCQRSFAKQFDMTRHRQYVHCANSKLYICEKCGRTFARSDHLRKHLLTHKHLNTNPTDPSQLPKSYPCDICGRTYSRIDNMKKHQKKHKENKEIKVEINPELENIKAEVTDNNDVKIKEEIDSMAFGEVSYHFMSGVECELKDPPRRYACEYCGRGFMRSDHLKNHKRTHTGEKPYRCDQCDRRFAKQFVMTRHKQNVHCANSKIYVCEECGRTFARSDHLKNHLRVHIYGGRKKSEVQVSQGNEIGILKPFPCDECGKSYSRKDKLKKHKEKHTSQGAVKLELQLVPECQVNNGEAEGVDDATTKNRKRHTCDHCGKDFGRSDHLKTHKRTHTGEKPFQCSKCDKSFCKSTDLTRHEKTHLGIKRYSCSDCGKAFSRLDNLKTHSKIHVDAKASSQDGKNLEKCDSSESNLANKKKFSCNVCPEVFNKKKALARHWKSKHRDNLIGHVQEVTDSSQIDNSSEKI